MRRRSIAREVEVGEDGEEDGAGALDEGEEAPALHGVGLDAEDAEGEEAAEGRGYGLASVEDGKAAGQLHTSVEGRLVVDDEREEGRLGHAEEPADRHEAGEVFGGGDAEGTRPEDDHHRRQHAVGTVLLAQDGKERCRQHVWDEEDRQREIVLVCAFHAEGLLKAGGFGVAEVRLIEGIEEVHDGEGREDAKVEFPDQAALGGLVEDHWRLPIFNLVDLFGGGESERAAG